MQPVTDEMLARCEKAARENPMNRLARRALSKCAAEDAAFVQEAAARLRHKFSLEIETLPVTNQKSSGRCWLFAAANVLRERIAKARNLEDFELSQSYLAFWDKFERANFFLESILKTADRPADDRTVMFILETGVHDGGQWDMFANIVRKYGIVPKDVFDETHQSSNTRRMNYLLNRFLKRCAARLRGMPQDPADLQREKEAMLLRVYDFLVRCYGEPPKRFDFEFVDKEKRYHVEEGLTPLAFAERTGALALLEDTVSIIHAPTKDKPFDRVYTVRFLGNVAGGREVRHLNLSLCDFKAAVLRQLSAGCVVWFGSDVGHDGDRELGLWDDALFDYETLTGLPLDISKEDGLDMRFSAMDHAMVLTGVHLENGKPVRWRIENSWGDEHGKKGYYICSDSWFDRYVYQAAVERRFLGEKAALCGSDPIELAPWDPMGTLAR